MWSEALKGYFPVADHLGNPIAPQHGAQRFALRGRPLCPFDHRTRLAFTGLKADLQYEKFTFRFFSYGNLQTCR
eukprot:5038668-Alexandrium_andersonii.AAC.1